MTGPYANNAATFLIQTVFGLYIMAVLLRTLLQWIRADARNPITQFLITITNPPLLPLQRLLPAIRGLSLGAVVLLLVLQGIEIGLMLALSGHGGSVEGIAVMAVAELLQLVIQVYTFGLIIYVILSWLAVLGSMQPNPVSSLLEELLGPVLSPIRRMMPDLGGIDLSPIVLFIGLQLVAMLFVAPVRDVARMLLSG
jgi:YggT family protein